MSIGGGIPAREHLLAAMPNGDGTKTVIGCEREGHPGPYAHTHPYLSALCGESKHDACAIIGQLSHAPTFCDCECHERD